MFNVVREIVASGSCIALVGGFLIAGTSGAADFHRPRYEPDEMVAKVEAWIGSTRQTQLANFVLDGVSFDYVRDTWSLFYECKPIEGEGFPLGCHFGVTATNGEAPEFVFHPGL